MAWCPRGRDGRRRPATRRARCRRRLRAARDHARGVVHEDDAQPLRHVADRRGVLRHQVRSPGTFGTHGRRGLEDHRGTHVPAPLNDLVEPEAEAPHLPRRCSCRWCRT